MDRKIDFHWRDLEITIWHDGDDPPDLMTIRLVKDGRSYPVIAAVREKIELWVRSPFRHSMDFQTFMTKMGLE